MFSMKPRDDVCYIAGSQNTMENRKLIQITIFIIGKKKSPSVIVTPDFPCSGSLATAGGVEANKCSADAMSRCTDPLKVVTDNKDLGFATSKDELDEMCP